VAAGGGGHGGSIGGIGGAVDGSAGSRGGGGSDVLWRAAAAQAAAGWMAGPAAAARAGGSSVDGTSADGAPLEAAGASSAMDAQAVMPLGILTARQWAERLQQRPSQRAAAGGGDDQWAASFSRLPSHARRALSTFAGTAFASSGAAGASGGRIHGGRGCAAKRLGGPWASALPLLPPAVAAAARPAKRRQVRRVDPVEGDYITYAGAGGSESDGGSDDSAGAGGADGSGGGGGTAAAGRAGAAFVDDEAVPMEIDIDGGGGGAGAATAAGAAGVGGLPHAAATAAGSRALRRVADGDLRGAPVVPDYYTPTHPAASGAGVGGGAGGAAVPRGYFEEQVLEWVRTFCELMKTLAECRERALAAGSDVALRKVKDDETRVRQEARNVLNYFAFSEPQVVSAMSSSGNDVDEPPGKAPNGRAAAGTGGDAGEDCSGRRPQLVNHKELQCALKALLLLADLLPPQDLPQVQRLLYGREVFLDFASSDNAARCALLDAAAELLQRIASGCHGPAAAASGRLVETCLRDAMGFVQALLAETSQLNQLCRYTFNWTEARARGAGGGG